MNEPKPWHENAPWESVLYTTGSYAQAGQDQWIVQQFPNDYQGFAVDVGAFDGVVHSNTLLLELRRWTVLCIEPNPVVLGHLKRNRSFVQAVACDAEPKESAILNVHMSNVECYTSLRPKHHKDWHPEPDAKWAQTRVPVKTLNQLLAQAEFPKLDVLSIDVEGTELDVLKGIDLTKWTPKVICVESWDPGTCDEYLKVFGYKRVKRMLVDDIYTRDET